MIEFFLTIMQIHNNQKTEEKESFQNNPPNLNDNIVNFFLNNIPMSWVVAAVIISFGTAYLAFKCSNKENPATRAVYTLFAFFFSGFYLLYYLIVHVILGYNCFEGKSISNIISNSRKK